MTVFRHLIKSKIHGVTITKTELDYNGSIGIDEALLLKSDMVAGEKVQVLNFNNGERFETYIIKEEKDSGTIALYGPAARLGRIGDKICVISYVMVTDDEIGRIKETVVLVNEKNEVLQ